ncbi:MAG: hypothetical protein AAGF51_15750 [Pseudomonadota bacterium]
MVCDETDTQSEPDKRHDPFSTQAMATHGRCAAEIAHPADDVVMDFWARFPRADNECGVHDVLPFETFTSSERPVRLNGKEEVFFVDSKPVANSIVRFASGVDNVDASMVQQSQEFTSI